VEDRKTEGLALIADRLRRVMTVYDRAFAALRLTMQEGETDEA
jgi:hypothetical protein